MEVKKRMFRRVVGETIFETLLASMVILVGISIILMTAKIQQVFESADANQYEQLVDDFKLQQEVWDTNDFNDCLDSMNAILMRAEAARKNEDDNEDDSYIHDVFQVYYDTIEKGKQKEFSNETEMLHWMKRHNLMNCNRVRCLITGYSKPEAIIMEVLLWVVLTLLIVAFVYRKKLLVY